MGGRSPGRRCERAGTAAGKPYRWTISRLHADQRSAGQSARVRVRLRLSRGWHQAPCTRRRVRCLSTSVWQDQIGSARLTGWCAVRSPRCARVSAESVTTTTKGRCVTALHGSGDAGEGAKERLAGEKESIAGAYASDEPRAHPSSLRVDNEVGRGKDPVRRVGRTERVSGHDAKRQWCTHLQRAM